MGPKRKTIVVLLTAPEPDRPKCTITAQIIGKCGQKLSLTPAYSDQPEKLSGVCKPVVHTVNGEVALFFLRFLVVSFLLRKKPI